MSNLDPRPAEVPCAGAPAPAPARRLITGHEVALGGPRGLRVTRTLPTRARRMVGAWCFVDHYGPHPVAAGGGMRVPPHPHTGLQTVSWLLDGAVRHRDSLGHDQLIRPGQLNLMTAGAGIAHAEETPPDAPPVLHGVQLWVALPPDRRAVAPDFAHHADLPRHTAPGLTATVLVGTLAGATSPARAYSPLLGAELALGPGADVRVPLDPAHEHAVLTLAGRPDVEGMAPPRGALLYLGTGRRDLHLRAPTGPATALLLGGEPYPGDLVMWWNFVAGSHEEIVAARAAWEASTLTPPVPDHPDRLSAPPMPIVRLVPRPPGG
ncbi:pirin family protein [Pilimelia anulata]|uniref:pirin family protein n=1 Tax=Pilimelia anulata TaxID=53371 RepID=UPI00166F3714|nr:pirin family protein [Pilimelia anulata]